MIYIKRYVCYLFPDIRALLLSLHNDAEKIVRFTSNDNPSTSEHYFYHVTKTNSHVCSNEHSFVLLRTHANEYFIKSASTISCASQQRKHCFTEFIYKILLGIFNTNKHLKIYKRIYCKNIRICWNM